MCAAVCAHWFPLLAGITEVCDTTGVCVSRDSTQRPLADVVRPSVWQRSVKHAALPCNFKPFSAFCWLCIVSVQEWHHSQQN